MKPIPVISLLFAFCFSFSQQLGKPAGFIENKGQVVDQHDHPNPSVLYLLNTPGLNVQLRKNGFSYDVFEVKKSKLNESVDTDPFRLINNKSSYQGHKHQFHRVDIDFLNSKTNVELIAEEKSDAFDNYFNIDGSTQQVSQVYQFKKVTYRNIYDNIDICFFIPADHKKPVEYNFIIHPGGKITDIQMRFNGAKTNLEDNKIKIRMAFGIMEESLPFSWMEAGKKTLDIRYRKIQKDVYGFDPVQNTQQNTIVIDPVPIRLWGTYYGGNSDEFPESMDVDNNNNVYVSGYTYSTNNIATAGAYQSFSNGTNGFIAKFDTNGNRVWGSYYRYSTLRIKLDPVGNVYIHAKTLTANPYIPSTGCFQSVKNNYNDTYLIKLDNNGFKLWGTYYGGNDNEVMYSIAFDSSNNVYVAGGTNSSDVFSTPGAFQPANAGSQGTYDGFLAKFDPNGNRVWGTFYGGTDSDGFFYCKVSNDGYLYAVGSTRSNAGIATPGSYQPVYASGYTGMVVKFDLNGQRIWGTYIGNDATIGSAVLKDDELLMVGLTSNTTGIATPNTFYPVLQTGITSPWLLPNENSFIISFNVQTQQKNWGTYFIERFGSIVLNQNHEAIFAGDTQQTSGIATNDGYMPLLTGFSKSYLIKLNSSGQRVWGTYYGGNGVENAGLVAIDHNDDIFLYGRTITSTSGIATTNAHQTTIASNNDTFLVKFRDCLSATTTSSNSPVCIGNPIQLTASGGTNYVWTGPNGFTSNIQNPTILNATPANSGSYSCAITGTGGCDNTNTITVSVGDTTAPVPNIATLPNIAGDCNTPLTAPTANDNCAGAITGTTTDPLSYPLPGNYTIHWTYNDGNGNVATQNQSVVINAVALPTLVTPQTFCIQQNATLNSIVINGQNIKWYDAQTGGNLLPASTPLVNATTYYASQTINTCESLRVPVAIQIQNTPAPTGNTTQSFCSTQNATLADLVLSGNTVNWYNSPTSSTPLPLTTLLVDATTYYATQTITGCESVNRVAVTVTLINTLNAVDFSVAFCDDLNDNTETVNLTTYNPNLINPTNCTFNYYHTLNGANNQVVADEINNPTALNLSQGTRTVYVRITSNNGCNQVVKLVLEVFAKPVVGLSDTEYICKNAVLTLHAGSGFDSYLWSTGQTSPAITITQPGNYSVTVTDNHALINCSTTKNIAVVWSDKATIKNIETLDWTDIENVIVVNVNGIGDYEYSLDGQSYQSSPIFYGLESGNYMVYVKDRNGCGIIQKDVYLLMYPRFFTPNNDAANDTWKIKFSQAEPPLKVKIFDRYGKLLKTMDNKLSWDGTYNGNLMPADDYWFVVIRADGREHKGHFTLKR